MSTTRRELDTHVSINRPLSDGERAELELLGFIGADGKPLRFPEEAPDYGATPSVSKRAISNVGVLNEAYDYPIPSTFSRGMRVDLRTGTTFLWISGTASVDENGETIHKGDFRAQCWRTWRNITELLAAEGATWQDIVRTTCYLRDIERDYEDFNEIRTYFLRMQNLDPVPASTGIQARLCREDLLVEIEAIAILDREKPRE
jgi:enamine deaminase RidA (YjgF/YER057c/UK114 family)